MFWPLTGSDHGLNQSFSQPVNHFSHMGRTNHVLNWCQWAPWAIKTIPINLIDFQLMYSNWEMDSKHHITFDISII